MKVVVVPVLMVVATMVDVVVVAVVETAAAQPCLKLRFRTWGLAAAPNLLAQLRGTESSYPSSSS